MQRRALITGATGFLGSHIAQVLRAAQFDVVTPGKESLDPELLASLLQSTKPDMVIHAAGSASVEGSMVQPLADFRASAALTADVLEAIRLSQHKCHFFLLSSASIYGAPQHNPISEDCLAQPISPYGYHKLIAEILVQEAQELFGLKATIFRVFSSYGERIRRQVVHDLCVKLLQSTDASLVLRGTGAETRDFIHASDVANAIVHAFEHSLSGTFNLASGRQTSISELADLVQRHLGTRAIVEFDGEIRAGIPRFWQANIAKFAATGFTPRIPLEQGIAQYCDWFKRLHVYPSTQMIQAGQGESAHPLSINSPLIGFASMGTWMGGIAYLDLLTQSLAQLPSVERPRLALVVLEPEGINLHHRIIERASEIIFVGKACHDLKATTFASATIRKVNSIEEALEHIDLFFPVNSNVIDSAKAVSWIPDFQHLYLPHLFSAEARTDRDRRYAEIAERAAHVVFSSQDAARDFERYNRRKHARVHVLPFYSMPDEQCFQQNPQAVAARYNLPEKFLICCNQFWEHKNHPTLFSAIKILRDHGVHVKLVCTGALQESRNPEYINKIRDLLISLGIQDLVHILGEIPRSDQLQLMRAALAVVQPSLFEGWSTVVEDARAFGKFIFLSDLKVHREQAPRDAIYFDPQSPMVLAEKIVDAAGLLKPGPDLARESRAREDAKELTAGFARNFMGIVREVVGLPKRAPLILADQKKPDLSIVLATKNRVSLLKQMLASLGPACDGLQAEIIVIDGGSTDGSKDVLSSISGVQVFDEERVLGGGRHSWPELYNFGFNQARGKWSIFASDDILFEPRCFSNALAALNKAPPNTGGGIFFYKNQISEETWQYYGIDFLARHLPLLNYGLIQRELFLRLGGLSTDYQFYAADGDITYKIAQAGYVLSPLPGSFVTHHNELDAQKKVNLKAVEHDMGLLRERWSKFGEGESVRPRRMLWDPSLAPLFQLSLENNLCKDTLCLLWRVIALAQHGFIEEAARDCQKLKPTSIPSHAIDLLHRYLAHVYELLVAKAAANRQ